METTLKKSALGADQVADQGQGQGDGGAAASGSAGETKKKPKSYRKTRKTGKIHIRLPSIEAYQKEIEFAAEAPGRVVVRLERLMGSDKIRPVDGKYMDTLIERLEEEETLAWAKRIKLRKKAETERFRRLAINGLMEPGPDMQDLFNHPVFRVNRILNRLSKLDNNFSSNPTTALPPILEIEPFENDETGASFKEYPYHRLVSKQCEQYKDKPVVEEEPDITTEVSYAKSYAAYLAQTSKTETVAPEKASEDVDTEEEEEEEEPKTEEPLVTIPMDEQGEPVTEPSLEDVAAYLDKDFLASLSALQDKYDVEKITGFEDMWKPFRCELVEKVFHDQENMEEMYDIATDVLEVYIRQGMVLEEHLKSGHNNVHKLVERQSHDQNEPSVDTAPDAAAENAPAPNEAEPTTE